MRYPRTKSIYMTTFRLKCVKIFSNFQMLDRLGDIMTFGALIPCHECDGGQLDYRSGVGYQCTGDMSEWTKCQYNTRDPGRKPFVIPIVSKFKLKQVGGTFSGVKVYNKFIASFVIGIIP